MSDQQEQPASMAHLTPGELLRQERELQGRTVQQVAGDLHIGVYMVEAIEKNQFAVLGAPVFARGHLRKYAGLLGLSVERVQQLYQNLSDRPRDQDPVPSMHRDTEPSIPMSPDSKQRRTLQRPAKWTFVIAGGALLLVGIIAWILHLNSKPVDGESAAAPTETTSSISSEAPPIATTLSSSGVNGSAATTNVTNNAPRNVSGNVPGNLAASDRPTAPPAATPQVATRGKVRLRFSFNQESWVEVYDARGTRLLYDVGFPGQTRGVDVDPPAQIVLGQAGAVSTEVNGRAVTVPPRRIANQVARFTIGADGAAQ